LGGDGTLARRRVKCAPDFATRDEQLWVESSTHIPCSTGQTTDPKARTLP